MEEIGSSSSSANHHAESAECFQKWMKTQEESQSELLEALQAVESRVNSHVEEPGAAERELMKLVDKSIEQFEDYIDRRTQLAKRDVAAFFAPAWCTARETSLLWIGGCRPSIFTRLAFSVTGLELETRVVKFLKRMKSVVGDLRPEQMEKLNDLRMRTIREEERLSGKQARVQEEVAEETIVEMIAKKELAKEELERALERQDGEILRIIEEADKLRIRTLNEITEILRPLQAVRFLVFSKKLHLCVRDWGIRYDQRHGRSETDAIPFPYPPTN